MNNTKSQNGNLYSLTLLVKKNKKFSEKSGLTSEKEKTGGVGMAFAWEAANRGGPGGFYEGSKAQKAYCLRAKHTISRKYGPKIAENGRKKLPSCLPVEGVAAVRSNHLEAGGRRAAWRPERKIQKVFALTFVGYELFQNLKTHFAPFLSYSFTHETLGNVKLHILSFLCKKWCLEAYCIFILMLL